MKLISYECWVVCTYLNRLEILFAYKNKREVELRRYQPKYLYWIKKEFDLLILYQFLTLNGYD
jgi:hypothetical protein